MAQSGSGVGQLNATMGKLQRQLYKGEYHIFKYAQIFESDFIQITKRGEIIDVHNHVRMVTVGIASSSPMLLLPDVMLLAHPATSYSEPAGRSPVTRGKGHKAAKTVELTRLLPLKFVWISVHNREKQQLRLKFPTGRSCYLQLCPPLGAREDLFACWENLVYLLRPPVDSNSSTYTTAAGDGAGTPGLEEEDKRSLAVAEIPGKEDQDQINIRSLYMVSEVAGATSPAFAGGEELQCDSQVFSAVPDIAAPNPKATELDEVSAAGVAADATAGAWSVAMTMAAAPEQLSRAITAAATQDPGGSKPGIAIADAANMSSKSIEMAWVGAANQPSECPANTSFSSETSTIVATAKAEPTCKTIGETTNHPAAGPLVSGLPREGLVSEQAGRQQQALPTRAEVPKARRDGRGRRERERALQRLSGRSLRQKNDQKEEGTGSPGGSGPVTAHGGTSRLPIAKDSRTPHTSRRGLSVSSSGSTTERRSRVSSFLSTIRATLTTKTVASP